jgi:hypothetical protein
MSRPAGGLTEDGVSRRLATETDILLTAPIAGRSLSISRERDSHSLHPIPTDRMAYRFRCTSTRSKALKQEHGLVPEPQRKD